jgi:chromosome segregation ATPase
MESALAYSAIFDSRIPMAAPREIPKKRQIEIDLSWVRRTIDIVYDNYQLVIEAEFVEKRKVERQLKECQQQLKDCQDQLIQAERKYNDILAKWNQNAKNILDSQEAQRVIRATEASLKQSNDELRQAKKENAEFKSTTISQGQKLAMLVAQLSESRGEYQALKQTTTDQTMMVSKLEKQVISLLRDREQSKLDRQQLENDHRDKMENMVNELSAAYEIIGGASGMAGET